MTGHRGLFIFLAYILVPILTTVISLIAAGTITNAYLAFAAILGICTVFYLISGAIRAIFGKPAFKNVKRWVFIMLIKAAAQAFAIIMGLALLAAGAPSLQTWIHGRAYLDELVLIYWIVFYVVIYVVAVICAKVLIKGE
jgi:hypothetical protein